MRKGITPVVSVVLLSLMTIGAAVLGFVWINTVQSNVQESAGASVTDAPGSDCSRLNIISARGDGLVVSNVGCDTISSVNVIINGELTSYDLDSPVGPGGAALITFTDPLSPGDYSFQVVLSTGVSASTTVSDGGAESGFTGEEEGGAPSGGCEESSCSAPYTMFSNVVNTTSNNTCPCCGDDGYIDTFYNTSLICSSGGVLTSFSRNLQADEFGDFINYTSGKSACELAGYAWLYGNATANFGTSNNIGNAGGGTVRAIASSSGFSTDTYAQRIYNEVVTIGYDGTVTLWDVDTTETENFYAVSSVLVGDLPSSSSHKLKLADLDNDGMTDIITLNAGTGASNITVFVNDTTPFTGWSNYTINQSTLYFKDFAIGDVDNDNDLDIIVGNGTYLYILENDGTPFNGEWPYYYIGSNYTNIIRVADMDKDGYLDIISTRDYHSSYLLWWENDGTPFNNEWSNHLIDYSPPYKDLVILDMDKDNDLDIVAAISDDTWGYITIYINQGSSTNWISRNIMSSGFIHGLFVADFDNDNDLDIAASETTFDIFVNNGTINALWEDNRTYSQTIMYSFTMNDLEGDGDFDLIGNGADDNIILRRFDSFTVAGSGGMFGSGFDKASGPCCGDDDTGKIFANSTHCCQSGVLTTGVCYCINCVT